MPSRGRGKRKDDYSSSEEEDIEDSASFDSEEEKNETQSFSSISEVISENDNELSGEELDDELSDDEEFEIQNIKKTNKGNVIVSKLTVTAVVCGNSLKKGQTQKIVPENSAIFDSPTKKISAPQKTLQQSVKDELKPVTESKVDTNTKDVTTKVIPSTKKIKYISLLGYQNPFGLSIDISIPSADSSRNFTSGGDNLIRLLPNTTSTREIEIVRDDTMQMKKGAFGGYSADTLESGIEYKTTSTERKKGENILVENTEFMLIPKNSPLIKVLKEVTRHKKVSYKETKSGMIKLKKSAGDEILKMGQDLLGSQIDFDPKKLCVKLELPKDDVSKSSKDSLTTIELNSSFSNKRLAEQAFSTQRAIHLEFELGWINGE